MSTFGEWQPRYEEAGIATFPVRDKKPAVQGYLKAGLRASRQFAGRFAAEEAFGFACKRNNICVLDVDTPSEQTLCDALAKFGPTPIIVRSGSGNWQAWYRHNGERRSVRPDPAQPIDILGDGFVVAPPSLGGKGRYELITGSLADIPNLPTMRRPVAENPSQGTPEADTDRIDVGQRNDTLWRACMAKAKSCGSLEELMQFAVAANQSSFYEPLPDDEVMRVVASAWSKQLSGENWFGSGERVVVKHEEIDNVLRRHPDAFILLTVLRRHHWGRDFVVANAMHETMPGGGWSRKRLAAARSWLEKTGEIKQVRPASKRYGPALYRFKGGRK